ncbi:single-stranded DNA-binding protein [Nocardiopsis aegyptia]|uniref:Single-strand DNA-binding protein n=1 Tax=Nocardiopsis aegyptia TaxID=220378 RepID=A0A7Z0JCD8_9ACTN|nr:single-strand DNA-binding protein [Nocardiopsis aegyptia]
MASKRPEGPAASAGAVEFAGPGRASVTVEHDRRREEVVPEDEHHNEIVLVGRVTAVPVVRDLPSGDRLMTWRICVSRPPDTRFRGRRIDSITCVSFDTGVHDEVREWRLGDVVRMSGALRRRTWRGYDGVRSVHEVEVCGAALVRAAGSRRGAVH